MSLRKKRVGTVLPMTSLVSKNATTGTFAAGEKFIDWLAKTNQTAWQILPLHQTQLEKGSATKHIPSPYKGYGIGLDPRFLSQNSPTPSIKKIARFINDNNYWLEDYALFCALRDEFQTDAWHQWPVNIRTRKPSSIKDWQQKLATQVKLQLQTQARLHLAYQQLQKKAAANQIALIGDLPLYLSLNSPLVWRFQHLFDLGEEGQLRHTSGVPVGPKSHFKRQVWGHPLYKWQDQQLISQIEELFKIRLSYLAQLFDWVRLDHAKGLFTYAAMSLTTAKSDQYLPGPGVNFLEKIINFARQKKLSIYAEDTGDNLEQLRQCLHHHQLPGIKIFRYAFDEKRGLFIDQYLKIDQYPANTFAYTSTHDTRTLTDYLQQLSPNQLANLGKKVGLTKNQKIITMVKEIRDKIINSPAQMVLIPLQDWLYTTDRINIPGTEKEHCDSNWQYLMNIPTEDLPTKL